MSSLLGTFQIFGHDCVMREPGLVRCVAGVKSLNLFLSKGDGGRHFQRMALNEWFPSLSSAKGWSLSQGTMGRGTYLLHNSNQ